MAQHSYCEHCLLNLKRAAEAELSRMGRMGPFDHAFWTDGSFIPDFFVCQLLPLTPHKSSACRFLNVKSLLVNGCYNNTDLYSIMYNLL
jgi:hypothetical protein